MPPSTPGTPVRQLQLPPHLLDLEPFSTTSSSRFQSLYSDFTRQKTSNPTSYDANVQWWRRALESLVLSGRQSSTRESFNRFELHADRQLLERLRIEKLGKPIGLGSAITELIQSGTLIHSSTFDTSNKSIYDSGSIPYRLASFLIGKPLWWALEQTGVVGEDSYASSIKGMISSGSSDQDWFGQFVFVPLLEKTAEKVLDLHAASSHDELYTMDDFRRTFAAALGDDPALEALREDEARTLVRFLERDKRSIVSDGSVVKFIVPSATPDAKTITAVDRGVLELRSAVENLHRQVDSLQARCEECTQKAKDALSRSQKSVALSHVRLRKHLEGLLSKRLGALDNLAATLVSVEGTRGDVEIMRTYQSSTATLKTILSHPLLHSQTIDETMEALASINAEAKEVDETIRDAGDIATGVTIDDEDIEKELAALVAQEEKGKQEIREPAEERVPTLPEAPTTFPMKESDSASKEAAELLA